MRSDAALGISLDDSITNEYEVKSKKKTQDNSNYYQLSLFEVTNAED